MSAVTAEILTAIKARSPEEQVEILDVLAAEFLTRQKHEVRSINDETKQTLGFLIPNQSNVAWNTIFNDPTAIEELKRRYDNPQKGLTLEELIEKTENL